jgi:outer membrane receptor protein involved in Fe transport
MLRSVSRGKALGLLLTVSAGALVVGQVSAQEVAAVPEPESVTVTGSLISNSNFVAPTPVTSLNADDIADKAAGSVFEVIRDIPAFNATSGPSANSTGAQNASKANLNLRNLGATRTLVLINGDRHVPDSPTNVFDTNLIPTGLIKRIDIVTGGASATYGSDAVAGVVNFILDNHFEGFKGDVHAGISQYGDNVEFSPALTWGTSLFSGHGHLILGGEITISEGTPNMLSRGWGRLQPGVMSPTSPRAAGVPAQIVSNNVVTSAYNASGLIVGCTVPGGGACPLNRIAFGENGSTYNFAPGTVSGATEQIGGGDYGSFENPDQFLRAAYDRGAAMARFEYDLDNGVEFYAQAMYGGLRTFGDSFGAQVPNFNKYTVYANNPFLPASVKNVMTAQGINSFQYSASRQVDLGSIASRNRTDSLQGNIGAKGVYNLLGSDWAWNVDLGVGAAAFVPYIRNTPRTADFFESAYVVTGSNGAPACGPVATNPYFNSQPAAVKAALIANLSPNCVPYDIFGNNVQQNKAANTYFNSASNVDNEMRQYTLNVGFTGAPFTLPAGDVGVAFGYDWRRDAINSNNCADCKKLALMNQNYSTFTGQILVSEFYGEADIPVIKDVPFIQSLGINAAVRNTDYSTSGNVTTWKAGFTWDIDESIRLRGTRSHDIRAPNVNELFNPGSEGNPNIQNKVLGTSGFIKSNTVGNLALQPESGETWTGGVVVQPIWFNWMDGISVSMDYFNIKMKNIISTLGIQTIMDDYAVKGAASIYAQYVTPDPTNIVGVSRINVPQLNLNSQKTDGVDFEFDYAVPEDISGPLGAITFRALGTWIDVFHSITPTQDIDSVGTISAPKMAWNFTLSDKWEQWTSTLMVHYTSNIIYDSTLVGLDGLTPGTAAYNAIAAKSNSINRNIWPEAVYFDTRFAYDLMSEGSRKMQLYLNIDNITNKQPPIVAISLSGSPYDLVGRNFKVGLRFNY